MKKHKINTKATLTQVICGYPIGTEVTIVGHGSSIRAKNPMYRVDLYDGQGAFNAYHNQLKVVPLTKEELSRQKAELQAEIELIDMKLSWMKATKSSEFDEDEYKVWTALEVIENSEKSQVEKAKAIAVLLKEG